MINYTELTVEVLAAAFAFNKTASLNINGYEVTFDYMVTKDGSELLSCVANDTAPIEVYMEGKRDLVMMNARAVLRMYMMTLFGETIFDEDIAECDADYANYSERFDDCELHYMSAHGTTEVL